jgi:hypothetical protein
MDEGDHIGKLGQPHATHPHVINVDKNAAYPEAFHELYLIWLLHSLFEFDPQFWPHLSINRPRYKRSHF